MTLLAFGTTESGFGTIVRGVSCAGIPNVNLTARLLADPTDDTAVVTGERRLTRAELVDLVARVRGGLQRAGVSRGERVGLIGGHDDHFLVAHLAILGLGAVTVPLNPRSPLAELEREFIDLRLAHLVIDDEAVPVEAAALLAGPDVPGVIDLGDASFAELAAADPVPIVDVDGSEPAVMLLTSGTAGLSRPAVLTHHNLSISLDSVFATGAFDPSTRQAVLAIVPLFHVLGLNITVHLGLAAGATIVMAKHAGPLHVASLVEAEQVTILPAPPNLWAALAEADLEAPQFSSVAIAFSGAARLDRSVRDAVEARLGLRIDEGYGLTETSGTLASSVGVEVPIGSVGPPMPGVEVRLVDASGADVLIGDVGEVWVKGPMVSPGYWGPDGLEPAPEWLQTGDLAIVNDDGNLSIVDRIKDLIIVSGFNVHPIEVERVLVEHPSVARAAVVSEPDDRTGECVVAHVVAAPDVEIDVAALIQHCDRHLARYKVPRRIEMATSLPETAIGKVKRRDLL